MNGKQIGVTVLIVALGVIVAGFVAAMFPKTLKTVGGFLPTIY